MGAKGLAIRFINVKIASLRLLVFCLGILIRNFLMEVGLWNGVDYVICIVSERLPYPLAPSELLRHESKLPWQIGCGELYGLHKDGRQQRIVHTS